MWWSERGDEQIRFKGGTSCQENFTTINLDLRYRVRTNSTKIYVVFVLNIFIKPNIRRPVKNYKQYYYRFGQNNHTVAVHGHMCMQVYVCVYAHLVPALYGDPTSLRADNCTYIQTHFILPSNRPAFNEFDPTVHKFPDFIINLFLSVGSCSILAPPLSTSDANFRCHINTDYTVVPSNWATAA